MHRFFPSLILTTALLSTALPCHAEFSKWTVKDGKVAEMEIVSVDLEKGSVEFLTKAGKKAIVPLDRLIEADQARAKEWKPSAPAGLKSRYASVLKIPAEGGNPPRFMVNFVLPPGTLADQEVHPLKVTKCLIGGNDFAVSLAGTEGSFAEDPFGASPEHEQEFMCELKAGIDEAQFAGCDFEATTTVSVGSMPKELSGNFKLPKTEVGESQQMGPFTVTLRPTYGGVEVDKDGNPKKGEKPEIWSYEVRVDADPAREGEQCAMVCGRSITANHKTFEGFVEKDDATASMKVTIRYWSMVQQVPVVFSKAPGEKGKPMAPREDPFAREK